MGAQRAAVVEAAGVRAQVRAQRGDDRRVGRAAAVAGAAPESRHARGVGGVLGESALPDARLAGDEHERPGAQSSGLERVAEALALGLSADELRALGHSERV